MNSKWRRRLKRIIFIAAFMYIAGGVSLYFLQDRILFHPVTLKKEQPYGFHIRHKEINIHVSESSNLNIVQFFPNDSVSKGVVLYFHGNRKNISWYASHTPNFTRSGYEVWMIDYPGFGKSTGKFSEQTLYDWALHLYEFARSSFSPDSIILYGKSMGTGIAAQLATKRNCKRVILETPYYDFPSVLKRYLPFYPIDWIIHYKLPTHQYLQQIEVPVTIFHGTKDRVIPYRNAFRLKKFLKISGEFITIKGGHHNDLFEYKEMTGKLDSLLNQ